MKKRILFVNDEMQVGGVSKVLNNLLLRLDKNKYDVSLLVLHCQGEMIKEIPSYVNVIEGPTFFDVCDMPFGLLIKNHQYLSVIKKIIFFLSIKTGLITPLIKFQRNKMHINGYDTEIAFKEGICSIFVSAGDSLNKINWIHADYKVKNYASNYMTTMCKILKKFNHHVAVSEVAAKSFKEVFNLNEDVLTIHNIIDCQDIINKAQEDVLFRDERFSFLSIGRLHPQKSYDRLIMAASKLKAENYNFAVYIIGDGELKEELIKLSEKYNVLENVIFLGAQSNPYKYLKQADCSVLSSLYEGIPTVVYESLILHVPVISTKVAGVDEQITDKIGMIVENDVDSLYLGMKEILNSPKKIEEYKSNLSSYIYDNDKILKSIDRIL